MRTQSGSNSDNVFFCFVFLIVEGREDENNTKSGTLSARKREMTLTKRRKMAFHWRADDGPTLTAGLVFQGIRTSGPVLLINPIFL